MSKVKDNGGSAFPVVTPVLVYSDGSSEPPRVEERGLALRDYFAAKAMAAYVSANYEDCASNPSKAAQFAYQNADAMLTERKGQQP